MGAPAGNQNAAKAKRWSAAIERALERRKGVGLRAQQEALDELAERFLVAVEAGEAGAISGYRELGDRLEGKAVQPSEIDMTAEVSLREIKHVIVKPGD